MKRAKAGRTSVDDPPDLTNGVIVVLSGGPIDLTNPCEVRNRMDELIGQINTDPFVLAGTGGKGLKFKLLPGQKCSHLHHLRWRDICDLDLHAASPLILIGHSNGGAAVIDLARCLNDQGISVDFAFTADSVLTLNDNGNVNEVPPNVKLNLNPYVIPVFPAWLLLPFPFGQKNQREADGSLNGILNIGLLFDEPGAIAHRDAFYDLSGGDESAPGNFHFPEMLFEIILDVLHGESNDEIFQAAQTDLQTLANESHTTIELETTNFYKKLQPVGMAADNVALPLPQANIEALHKVMREVERQRLLAFEAMLSSIRDPHKLVKEVERFLESKITLCESGPNCIDFP